MAIHRPCTHGKVLCGLYRGTRTFAHKADHVIRNYGETAGAIAQGVALVITAIYPVAGVVTGAVGKGIQTYAQVRNEVN